MIYAYGQTNLSVRSAHRVGQAGHDLSYSACSARGMALVIGGAEERGWDGIEGRWRFVDFRLRFSFSRAPRRIT